MAWAQCSGKVSWFFDKYAVLVSDNRLLYKSSVLTQVLHNWYVHESGAGWVLASSILVASTLSHDGADGCGQTLIVPVPEVMMCTMVRIIICTMCTSVTYVQAVNKPHIADLGSRLHLHIKP